MELGKKLKIIRENANLKQSVIAELSGLSVKAISSYESGRVRVPSNVIEIYSKTCGVSMNAIFGYDEKKLKFIPSSNEETELIALYRKLSTSGKTELINFASYILSKEQSTTLAVAETEAIYIAAAHNDATLTDKEKKLMTQDINEL